MGQVLCSCRCCPKQRIKPAPYQPLSPDTEPSAIHDMAPLIETPRVVDKNFLQPLCLLLHSSDEEVQRTASAAVGNLAILGKFLIIDLVSSPILL
ncbi:hypothetical protein HMI55_003671 [Coelomomyces lativittatus]|nr:hypothetical protein HMI55_003671 [Coelomomyces lativittatus]